MINKTSALPELLAPAGNFEKLRAALLYGADAVYLAGQNFGMRAAAGNFSPDELVSAVEYAHERGKKVYITINTMPRDAEYDALARFLTEVGCAAPDAIIAADLGVIALIRKTLPQIPIHVSTQASAVSAAVCEEYLRLGASRVVLARELSIAEIAELRRRVSRELELEVFVHGSMCVSWSGMCLLSEYFTGRDANHGCCAQVCRWDFKLYEIEEAKHPDQRYPATEDEYGTFVLSSKDLCMVEHLPELIEAGVSSLKIEGRMKSAYYAAAVTNAYRMALDGAAAGLPFNPAWKSEVESVSHREYSTGYFFDKPGLCTEPGYMCEKAYIATVDDFDPATMTATLIQRNKICAGDEAELLTPGKYGQPFKAECLYDMEGNAIPSAPHPLMKFRMVLPFAAKQGDIVRK